MRCVALFQHSPPLPLQLFNPLLLLLCSLQVAFLQQPAGQVACTFIMQTLAFEIQMCSFFVFSGFASFQQDNLIKIGSFLIQQEICRDTAVTLHGPIQVDLKPQKCELKLVNIPSKDVPPKILNVHTHTAAAAEKAAQLETHQGARIKVFDPD